MLEKTLLNSSFPGALEMATGRLLPILACAVVTSASASDNGRYQAEVLQGGATPRVLLLDTRDGHFWTWSQAIRGSDQGLRYEGRLRPGTTPGETIFEDGIRHPHPRR